MPPFTRAAASTDSCMAVPAACRHLKISNCDLGFQVPGGDPATLRLIAAELLMPARSLRAGGRGAGAGCARMGEPRVCPPGRLRRVPGLTQPSGHRGGGARPPGRCGRPASRRPDRLRPCPAVTLRFRSLGAAELPPPPPPRCASGRSLEGLEAS